jgi:hypothetical protein
LTCGELKFGALGPCELCGQEPPNESLAVQFSDHFWSEDVLSQMGGAVKTISSSIDEPGLRLLAFICYVAHRFPDRLGGSVEPETMVIVQAMLAGTGLFGSPSEDLEEDVLDTQSESDAPEDIDDDEPAADAKVDATDEVITHHYFDEVEYCAECNGEGVELTVDSIYTNIPCSYCGGSGKVAPTPYVEPEYVPERARLSDLDYE